MGYGTLGSKADFSEQYYNTTDLPFTNSPLAKAYNIDITQIANSDFDNATVPAHKWPYQWYGKTVDDNYLFSDNWGFEKSMEMNGGVTPSHDTYPRGETIT